MDLKEVLEPIINFVKGFQKKERDNSKIKAKERLQLVLMQDRASVSPDFFEMMKKEIIEVIKKYIEIDEEALEVQLTRGFEGGLEGPALYANIPIKNIKPVARKIEDTSKDVSNNNASETAEHTEEASTETPEIVEQEKTDTNNSQESDVLENKVVSENLENKEEKSNNTTSDGENNNIQEANEETVEVSTKENVSSTSSATNNTTNKNHSGAKKKSKK